MGNLNDPTVLSPMIVSLCRRMPRDIQKSCLAGASDSWPEFMRLVIRYESFYDPTVTPDFARHRSDRPDTRPLKYYCSEHKANPTHNTPDCNKIKQLKRQGTHPQTGTSSDPIRLHQTTVTAPTQSDSSDSDGSESDADQYQEDDAQCSFMRKAMNKPFCTYCDGRHEVCGWKTPCTLCFGPHPHTFCYHNPANPQYNSKNAIDYRGKKTLDVAIAENKAKGEMLKQRAADRAKNGDTGL
jgi:hypothetical protein